MGDYRCQVVQQTQITDDIYRLVLQAGEIARKCSPGQFVHIKISDTFDPLLRRPFSIHRVHRGKGEIELFYRVIGQGTIVLQKAKPGDAFDVMGPLGQGFSPEGNYTTGLVIVGGMGAAPAFFLIDELLALGKKVIFLWGAKCGSEIFGISDLEKSGVDVRLSTEDGSRGHHGLVTDVLRTFLDHHSEDRSLTGFVCGPKAMLKKVQNLALETSFPWQVSLEERMACGIGICQGCAVKLKEDSYRMVCSDGPVFDLKKVEFDG